MSENLNLWNTVRVVPDTAKKTIVGGRLKGMTDINPVWRQKELTQQFGPCGIGWKYEITKQWLETGANGEVAAFTNIDLYIKYNGEWSEAIPGTGGSSFVANERSGLYTSDECFKMALTDAISVACKALGFGADVYWDKDSTKYSRVENQPNEQPQGPKKLSEAQVNRAYYIAKSKGHTPEDVKRWALTKYKVTAIEDLTKDQYDEFCSGMESMQKKGA